jgi:surface antigen
MSYLNTTSCQTTRKPASRPATGKTKLRRLASFTARALGAPIVIAGLGLGLAGTASAAVGPCHVESSTGLNERSCPSSADARLGWLANGTQVMISCQTAGAAYATGGTPSTDTIRDQLSNGDYVADYWMGTPGVGTFSPGIPRCGSSGSHRATVGDDPFPGGQCTWGADQLVRNLMVTDPSAYPAGHNYIDVWGNADQWPGSAASHGWTVVNGPAVHSIVVFQPGVQGADSTYGHVVLVTAVYSNGTFQIEEMNGPAGPYNYDYRTVADASGESFILIPPSS